MKEDLLSATRKAFRINQDLRFYGTFAEIGAGQEVARFFFQAGQASKTVAKTMSAYDMTFSDSIYGKGERYVSLKRLKNMLQHEFELLERRLRQKRGKNTCFFAFANTVTTSSQSSKNASALFSSSLSSCHGWLGVRFQIKPRGAYNEIFLHVHMLDRFRLQQQEALGVLGVNLLYTAFYLHDKKSRWTSSLVDKLQKGRIEVDFIQAKGPDMKETTNSILNLNLLQNNLTKGILFDPKKKPEERVLHLGVNLYQKPLLILRGKLDSSLRSQKILLQKAKKQLKSSLSKSSTSPSLLPSSKGEKIEPIVILEFYEDSFLKQKKNSENTYKEVLKQMEKIKTFNCYALISSFSFFFSLKNHLRSYTEKNIIFVAQSSDLIQIFKNHKTALYKKTKEKKEFITSSMPLTAFKLLSELFDPRVFLFFETPFSMLGSLKASSSIKKKKNPSASLTSLISSPFFSPDLKSFFSKEKSLFYLFQYLWEEGQILPIKE